MALERAQGSLFRAAIVFVFWGALMAFGLLIVFRTWPEF